MQSLACGKSGSTTSFPILRQSGDVAMIHRFDDGSEDKSNLLIPRSIVYGVLLTIIVSLGGGGIWVGTASTTAANLAAAVSQLNQRIDQLIVDNNKRFNQDEAASTQIDLRLTRMEEQLNFLVSRTGQQHPTGQDRR